MKKITLINPEQAQDLFNENSWTDSDSYFIKGVSSTSETILVDTNNLEESIVVDSLKVKFGTEYEIPLENLGNEITLELREIDELGALLLINSIPHFLLVYRNSDEFNIQQIGNRFPELNIIDFGSSMNENITHLDGIVPCLNLHTLNLDNCPCLTDISGLRKIQSLKTLWIDGFTEASQYHFISECINLERLSQNKSELDSLDHISNLCKLKVLWILGNSKLIDLSPISGLSELIDFGLNGSEELADLSPISSLSNLTNLHLNSCLNLRDLSPLSNCHSLIYLDISQCENIVNLTLSGLRKLEFLNLKNCENLVDVDLSKNPRLSKFYFNGCENINRINLTENGYIRNLDGLFFCKELIILCLDNCHNLNDISGLTSFSNLKTLWLDGFKDSNQFHFISSCEKLEVLSQNSSDLKNLEHLTNLKNLQHLYLAHNCNLSDLNPISCLHSLSVLNLNGDIGHLGLGLVVNSVLTDLTPLSQLVGLTELNLGSCINIENLQPLFSLQNLISLNLSRSKISDIVPLSNMKELTSLNLYNCKSLIDLNHISGLTSLSSIDLSFCDEIIDFKPLSQLKSLINLEIGNCSGLNDLSPLSELKTLVYLDLNNCNNINNLSPISNLKTLELIKIGSNTLSDLSPISGLTSLSKLELSYCNKIIDLNPLSELKSLIHLKIRGCDALTDISPLTYLSSLVSLEISCCAKLKNLQPLSNIKSLNNLNLSSGENITKIGSFCNLPELLELDLSFCPNVRDINKLSNLNNLKKLEWIDQVDCDQVLMKCAHNRNDSDYIIEKCEDWINQITLSKDPGLFINRLLNCIGILEKDKRKQYLISSCYAMRTRGIESELLNDLDIFTWETWCNLVLELSSNDAIECLHSALYELDIQRETEVVLGPVIVAASEFIEKYPTETSNILDWVNEKLRMLDNHPLEQRQVAPSAAVLFASLNMKEVVLFWLQKATDEKAPLWRDKVLSALIKHYADKEKFSEAQSLLDEMQLQDEKDMAISSIAQAMATKHPIDAGFLLDDIHNTEISAEAARKLLQQPAMLQEPQGLYQLILHLQANPEELARTLEFTIANDTEGKVSALLKQLFIQNKSSSPSATVMLELCKHPSIPDFVKPRALEKFKAQLQKRAIQEFEDSLPFLITEMKQEEMIDEEEAHELTKLIQKA